MSAFPQGNNVWMRAKEQVILRTDFLRFGVIIIVVICGFQGKILLHQGFLFLPGIAVFNPFKVFEVNLIHVLKK